LAGPARWNQFKTSPFLSNTSQSTLAQGYRPRSMALPFH
jgi:hypothetical protein